MGILEALAVHEAAVLECKKRSINTADVKWALELLEPYVRPDWIIPQFRYHALEHNGDSYVEREGQQQVWRANAARQRWRGVYLLEVRVDRLALKFHETKDLKVKDEILRLAREYGNLEKPWVGVRVELITFLIFSRPIRKALLRFSYRGF
jgi:hypothetical protein